MARGYLDLSTVEEVAKYAAKRGVSEVARGPGGFVSSYKKAGGSAAKLSEDVKKKREAFLDRHLEQMKSDENPGWEKTRDGWRPTRRHLALAMWAYSPTPGRLRAWLKKQNSNKTMEDRTKVEK